MMGRDSRACGVFSLLCVSRRHVSGEVTYTYIISCVPKWRENLRQRDVPSCEADDGCCSRIFGSA